MYTDLKVFIIFKNITIHIERKKTAGQV